MSANDYRKEQQLRSKEGRFFPEPPKPWNVLWNEGIRKRQNPYTGNMFLVYNGLKISELGILDIVYETSQIDGIFLTTSRILEISYIWKNRLYGYASDNVTNFGLRGTDHYHPRYGWYFITEKYSKRVVFKTKEGGLRWTRDNITNNPDSAFYTGLRRARRVIVQQWTKNV